MALTVDRATASDAAFIAKATLLAERAHTGKGIWDAVLGDNGVILEGGMACLEDVVESCPTAHIYFGNFFIIRSEDGKPVASCSCYPSPDYGLTTTFEALKPIVAKHLGWKAEEFQQHIAKLDFMNSAFPDDIPWDKSWFLETIYTEPEYRQRGLSSQLISRCIEEGKKYGAPRCLLIPAIGNDGAKRVYLNQGFVTIGEAKAPEAFDLLGCPGFEIMKLDF